MGALPSGRDLRAVVRRTLHAGVVAGRPVVGGYWLVPSVSQTSQLVPVDRWGAFLTTNEIGQGVAQPPDVRGQPCGESARVASFELIEVLLALSGDRHHLDHR